MAAGRSRRVLFVALPFVLVATAWLAVGPRPVLALAPVLVVLAAWLLARAPLSFLFTTFVLGAVLFENPAENPMQDRWHSILYKPGSLIYRNLDTALGLQAIHVSLLEIGVLLLLLALLVRRIRGELPPLDRRLRPVLASIGVLLVTVAGLEVLGLTSGGDFQQSLWQMRQLLWLPALVLLGLFAFGTDRARRGLVVGLVAVTVIRGLFGLYYWLAYCRPVGFHPHFITTHSDSILYVVVLVLLLHGLLEHRDLMRTVAFGVLAPLVAVVMLLNDRRLAYVALAYAVFAFVLLLRRPLKRMLFKAALAASPLLVAYVAIGLGSNRRIFAPVTALRSVSEQVDASSDSRRVEDLNLVYTLHGDPVLGRGFGHPYEEMVPAYDLSRFFVQYRYLPHNSVLWLFTAGGVVGFSAIWMVLPILLFVAARTERAARTPGRRMVAMAAVAALIAFGVMAFGDIGLQDWMALVVMTALASATARLAVDTGALGAPAPEAAPSLRLEGGVT